MRKSLLIAIMVLSFAFCSAQSGFYEGRYYNQQYAVEDKCGAPYVTVIGYYPNGVPIYAQWQDCSRAVWQSYYGEYTGYMWVWTNSGYQWQSRREFRTWWYYQWQNFTIRIG